MSQGRGVRTYRFGAVVPFALIHAGALGVLWTPFAPQFLLWLVGSYALRMFGITAGYHRYFSHRSFKLGRVPQLLMAVLAQTSGQKGGALVGVPCPDGAPLSLHVRHQLDRAHLRYAALRYAG